MGRQKTPPKSDSTRRAVQSYKINRYTNSGFGIVRGLIVYDYCTWQKYALHMEIWRGTRGKIVEVGIKEQEIDPVRHFPFMRILHIFRTGHQAVVYS